MNSGDKRGFQEAKAEAERSSFPRFHVGAVVVYKGHVVGAGHNSEKSDPLQKEYNRYRNFRQYGSHPVRHSLHAEVSALKSISYPIGEQLDWKKAKIFVYRICPGLPKRMGMARPCPACLGLVREKGIRDIYYTTTDGFCHERLI